MSTPAKTLIFILKDAIKRDRTTARRAVLLELLWQERHLTRTGLLARVEGKLGRGCFGDTAWKDTFYRDMRAVKSAFKAAGYELAYSRNHEAIGYYLRHHPTLNPNLSQAMAGSVAEVDSAQIAIYQQLSPAERFWQGCSISDTARDVVVYRTQMRHPDLSAVEAALHHQTMA
jgi:hypothetical protein